MSFAPQRRRKQLLRILLLGDAAVGKTSIALRFVRNEFKAEHRGTIGADWSEKEILVDDVQVLLHVWDTGPLEEIMQFGASFFRGADVVGIVCDYGNRSSLERIGLYRKAFLDVVNLDRPLAFPVVVIANKSDIPINERQFSSVDISNLCQSLGLEWFETSAKDNSNVEPTIRELTHRALRYYYAIDEVSLGLHLNVQLDGRESRKSAQDTCNYCTLI